MDPVRLIAFGLISAFVLLTILRFVVAPLDRFDEGVTVLKGMLVSLGEMPYRDFWTSYGPLDSYILGAVFKVFGTDVLVERLLAAAIAIAFACVSYWFLTRLGLARPMRFLMTGMLALVPISIPDVVPAVIADMTGIAVFGLFFLWLERPRRSLVFWGGVLTGLVSFTRPEFVAVLAGGIACGYLVLALTRRREALTALVLYGLAAAGVAAIVWVPTVLTAGLSTLYFDIVVHDLSIFPQGRSIPLGSGDDGRAVIIFTTCFVLVWIWGLTRAIRQRHDSIELARIVALLFSAILVFAWVKTRADAPHAMEAWPLTALLLGLLLRRRRPTPARSPGAEKAISLLALLVFDLAVSALAFRDLQRPTTPGASVARATIVGQRSWISTPQLNQLVAAIDRAVPPGAPIFVGLQHNDPAVFNDSMLYFLSNRRPGTVYEEFIPALTTTDAIQQVMVCQLQKAGVRLAILGPNTVAEPWNASARPSSARLFDWLAAHTVSRTELAPYSLLELRPDGLPPGC